MAKKKVSDLEANEFDTETFEKVSPDAFSTDKGRYKVSLPFLPPMEVDADSSAHACELYNKFTGVLNTTNRHEIEKLG
jgi:hypothetical protein